LNVRGRTPRVLSNIFEAATAWCFISVAVAFATNPSATLVRSPLGQPVHPFDYLWNGFYFAGGMAIFVGLVEGLRRVEVAGLIVLTSGLITASTALLWLHPDARAIAYLGFAAASIARTYLILRA
jgi:hypothetical protein